jgi:hypothetical protein
VKIFINLAFLELFFLARLLEAWVINPVFLKIKMKNKKKILL